MEWTWTSTFSTTLRAILMLPVWWAHLVLEGTAGRALHTETPTQLKQCEGPPASAACNAEGALQHFSFTLDSPTRGIKWNVFFGPHIHISEIASSRLRNQMLKTIFSSTWLIKLVQVFIFSFLLNTSTGLLDLLRPLPLLIQQCPINRF